MLRAILVDDEAAARRGMRMLLEQVGQVAVVGECSHGGELPAVMCGLDVDVVFLDVELPGMSGVEVARELGKHSTAEVVFLTAYSEYAVRAFEFEAADYLVKPVSVERVRVTVERLRRRRSGAEMLSLRNGSEQLFVPCREIRWIEAAGDYVCVHTTKKTLIVPYTLTDIEMELDRERFVRVHRSAIVRVDCVRGLRGLANRDGIVELDRGDEVRVSRTYRARLEMMLPLTC